MGPLLGLTFGILLVLAFMTVAVTGDPTLPVFIAFVMTMFFIRVFMITVIFLWPIWIAIIMWWTGYKVLLKKHNRKESARKSGTA